MDYPIQAAIIGGYLLLVTGVGIYTKRYLSSSGDFFNSGRSLSPLLVAMILAGAWEGSGVVLAYSNDIWPRHLDCVVTVDRKFAEQYDEATVQFLKAHVEATNWINRAKANPESAEYKLLVQISVNFTGRNEEVVKEALKYIDYKYEIDASFRNSFRDYTNKLVQFKIVGEDKLKERGYTGVDEFVARYIDDSYLEKAKR